MRLTLLRHLDIESGDTLAHIYTWHSGLVAECKYDDSKKAADKQLATNNANSSAALAQQSKFNQPVYQALIKYLTGNGEGMTPQEMALLNSQFLNQNSQQFNSAGSNVRAALLSRGVGSDSQPTGGNFVRGISNLEGLKGATTAAGLQDIQLENIRQRLANKFNAAGIFQGTGAGYGNQALGFSGLANENVNQIHNAFRPGILENFGQAFGKSLGGSLGAGIGGGLTGGLGGVIYGKSAASGGGMSG